MLTVVFSKSEIAGKLALYNLFASEAGLNTLSCLCKLSFFIDFFVANVLRGGGGSSVRITT